MTPRRNLSVQTRRRGRFVKLRLVPLHLLPSPHLHRSCHGRTSMRHFSPLRFVRLPCLLSLQVSNNLMRCMERGEPNNVPCTGKSAGPLGPVGPITTGKSPTDAIRHYASTRTPPHAFMAVTKLHESEVLKTPQLPATSFPPFSLHADGLIFPTSDSRAGVTCPRPGVSPHYHLRDRGGRRSTPPPFFLHIRPGTHRRRLNSR